MKWFSKTANKPYVAVERRTREKSEQKIYLAANLVAPEIETIGQLEFEIDKEKFTGRKNIILFLLILKTK